MLGEPEDGQHDGWDAAGVGLDVVEVVADGDVVAGAVDEEAGGHGHAVGVPVLVEEALADVLVISMISFFISFFTITSDP